MNQKVISFLVSIIVTLLPLTSFGSMELSPAPEPPGQSSSILSSGKTETLKIMSFNVLGVGTGDRSPENRLSGVAQTIRDQLPDSFGLQEASDYWRWTLKEELSDLYAEAGNYGRHLGLNEGTPIFYLKDKFVCLAQGVFWLSDRPLLYSNGWDTSVPRIAAWALLVDKATGFAYIHYNTHFDHIGELARTNSAALMTEKLNSVKLPAVLTGDFNCKPDSVAYSYFTAGGLADARLLAAKADKGRTYHGYKGEDIRTGQPIDFIFTRQSCLESVESYAIIHTQYGGQYPSDHFAIMATLTLKN
ncbi:MAG: endonuclease/exonuclease/phosphatase family protein [Oscillospiraceae bacterium]|jgi:endonuclease/exonuclease/phosphatase family metal-dependent hydrolase|nr:endonuclease/exonuclease/phosphatase family protein [Oscillospiraceae bacterium]